MVEPLSPELALIDQELAERARAQLLEPRGLLTPRADRTEPVEAKRRSRGKTTAIVAASAVAAVLGGAGAIWARYDGDNSSVRESEQPATRPQSETPATTSTGGGLSTTRSRRGVTDTSQAVRNRAGRVDASALPS